MPKGDGMTADVPSYQVMKEIIWSDEGRKAAVDATHAGNPAVSGVDLLLQEKLPGTYRHIAPANVGPQLPSVAGSVVANVMREMGYVEAGRGPCPEGCVAKSGKRWKKA